MDAVTARHHRRADAAYQDARFMLVATPSGISLAPEGGALRPLAALPLPPPLLSALGSFRNDPVRVTMPTDVTGAHQSINSPLIGLSQPGLVRLDTAAVLALPQTCEVEEEQESAITKGERR